MGYEEILKKWGDESDQFYGHGKFKNRGVLDNLKGEEASKVLTELKGLVEKAEKGFESESKSIKDRCKELINGMSQKLLSYVAYYETSTPQRYDTLKEYLGDTFSEIDQLVDALKDRKKLIKDGPGELEESEKEWKSASTLSIAEYLRKMSHSIREEHI